MEREEGLTTPSARGAQGGSGWTRFVGGGRVLVPEKRGLGPQSRGGTPGRNTLEAASRSSVRVTEQKPRPQTPREPRPLTRKNSPWEVGFPGPAAHWPGARGAAREQPADPADGGSWGPSRGPAPQLGRGWRSSPGHPGEAAAAPRTGRDSGPPAPPGGPAHGSGAGCPVLHARGTVPEDKAVGGRRPIRVTFPPPQSQL